MRHTTGVLTALLMLPGLAVAEVVELEGDDLLNAYVTGISLEQPVTDTPFASDDEDIRETVADQKNQLGQIAPPIAVSNAESLQRERSLDSLLADVKDAGTRDLVEDAITQTALGPRLDINLQRVASETGITPGTPSQDFQTLRGSLLEVMPITTGYQFEFNNRF